MLKIRNLFSRFYFCFAEYEQRTYTAPLYIVTLAAMLLRLINCRFIIIIIIIIIIIHWRNEQRVTVGPLYINTVPYKYKFELQAACNLPNRTTNVATCKYKTP